MTDLKNLHPSTLCAHLGRGDNPKSGFVSQPSTRGSTYLYPNLDEFKASANDSMQAGGISYGRYGSQNTRELESALAKLDGAYGAMITPSGFSAISTAILGFVSKGDHVLMADTVYSPSRKFADQTLSRMGIDTSFYSPDQGHDIEEMIQSNTRVIFLESPGSLTLEVQDMDAIIAIAQKHHVITILDNTWATSLNYPAISKGINVSVQAATKYIGGHSDLMMGVITTDQANWDNVRKAYIELGHSPGTEETMLALRGLRTLPCRLKQHAESALKIAQWLEQHEQVDAVHCPALPSNPYHDLFNKQFVSHTGLFSFSIQKNDPSAISAFVDGMNLFSIGVSWGGFESLILPSDPRPIRTVKPWTQPGQLIRLSIGLEYADDLLADLDAGLARL